MTRTLRACTILLVAGWLLALPANAELLLELPWLAVANVLLIASAWLILSATAGTVSWLGMAAGLGALSLAPLSAWPIAFVALARPDQGRRRWWSALTLAGVAIVSAALRPGVVASLPEIAEGGAPRILDAFLPVGGSLASVFTPWAATRFGLPLGENPLLGILIVGVALSMLQRVLIGGATRPWHTMGVLTALGAMSSVLPGIASYPRAAHAALFAWMAVVVVVYAGGLLIDRSTARAKPALRVAALVALVAATSCSGANASRHWGVFSEFRSAWTLILAENPYAPEYRWQSACVSLRHGDLDSWKRDCARYFETKDALDSRRREFAAELVRARDEDLAFNHLDALRARFLPQDRGIIDDALGILARRQAWDPYFEVGERAAVVYPDLHVPLARSAQQAGRAETFRTHLDAALALEPPPLAALELNLRDLLKRQDREALKILGERAIAAYPASAVGYLALGKAAKIVRDDDQMIAWHRQALERDPSLAELHYDLGLVHHGRPNEAASAAHHYRRLLELVPNHPRRQTIERWITSLTDTARAGGD